MFVIPKNSDKGQKVVDPQRMDALPPEGRDVGDDHPEYWMRRAQDGDIVIVPSDQVAAAKEKADKAEAKRNEDALAAAKKAAEAPAPQAPKK